MNDFFVAKLLVPQRSSTAIPRAALLSRLGSAAPASIGLLQAPAGYGKTSLLTDLANESGAAVSWLSIDKWDRDPVVFLSYLDSAVRRALFMPPKVEVTVNNLRQLLAAILATAVASGRDLDLILDDVHELDGAVQTLELLDYLMLRLPPNCRMFLATRTQLTCDSWPRLSAGGRTVQLEAGDLLMTDDEIRQVWLASSDDPIDDDVLAKLSEASRGWPVAVALAARQGGRGVADLRTQLSDFLASEVITKLPLEARTFIEETSALDTLSGGRCAALLSGRLSATEANEMIDRIAEMNLPATIVSTNPLELRLHPLVRELIESRGRASDEGVFRSKHVLAGDADLAAGNTGEALSHYAVAEAWPRLASVIAEEAPRAYREGRWHSIATWLALLPNERLQAKPEMVVWQARILVRLGQSDQALALLAHGALLNSDSGVEMRAAAAVVRTAALRTKGELGTAVEAGREAKRLAFESNAAVEIVAEARKELGLSLVAQGSFEDGVEELKAALEMHQARGDAADIAFVSGCVGSAYYSIGRLPEAVAYLEQARQKFDALGNSKELGWVLNNLGVTYWGMGSASKARDVLGQCLTVSRSGGHRRAEGFALASLADVDRFDGDLEAGRRRYQEVQAIADEVGDVTLGTLALIGLADLERRDGQLQAAETLARRSIASAEARLAESEEALARLTLARLARRLGNTEEALSESAAALSELEAEGVAGDLCEALVCRAEVLIDLRSHRSELNTTLRRLDEVIDRLGHGQFLLYSDRARDILRYAVSRRISDTYEALSHKLDAPAATLGQAAAGYPPIAVTAFGGLEITLAGRELDAVEWGSEKGRELFLLLLVSSRPMTRGEIVANLWPDGDPKKAASVFHSTLHRVRRALYPKVIIETGGWYSLQPEGAFSSDVGRFLQITQTPSTDDFAGEAERLGEAMTIYRGPFAPSLFSEWAEEMRRRFHERFLDGALSLAQAMRANKDYERAAETFQRILDFDNLNEDSWCGLLLSQAASGGLTSAARVFKRYEALLRSEIGERPSGRMMFLYRQLREQRRAAS